MMAARNMVISGQVDRDIYARDHNKTKLFFDINDGIDDFILGYLNGLLDADMTDQFKKCDKWRVHAKDSFNIAWDLLEQSLDIWLSFSEKFDFVKDALGNILLVTPDIIKDVLDCGLVEDVSTVAKWVNYNDDPTLLVQNLITNLLKNWFKMATMMISIPIKAVA